MKIPTGKLKKIIREELFYRQFHRDTLIRENRELLLKYFAEDEDKLEEFLARVKAVEFERAADEWGLGLDQQFEIHKLLGL